MAAEESSTKYCYCCKEDVPTSNFGRNKTRKDGFSDECKPCARKRDIDRRAKRKTTHDYIYVSEKTCSTCRGMLPRGSFHMNNASRDRLTNICKHCQSVLDKKKREDFASGKRLKKILHQKTCPTCKKILLVAFFSRCATTIDGFQDVCKSCLNMMRDSRNKRRREENKAKKVDETDIKACSSCHVEKTFKNYYNDATEIDGKNRVCKQCVAKDAKKLRQQYVSGEKPKKHVTEKTCPDCASTLCTDKFYRNASSPDGFASLCKACQKIRNDNWRKTHPEKNREKARRYKVNKSNANVADFTTPQWDYMKFQNKQRCSYCGRKRALTRDHVTPLSKGGDDTMSNIVPVCVSCNSKKGNRLPPIPVQPFLKLGIPR